MSIVQEILHNKHLQKTYQLLLWLALKNHHKGNENGRVPTHYYT